MPAIGLGTFGSDHVTADEIAAAVKGAAAVGYRHFDCASVYRNEDRIGFALQELIAGGIPREELWITSKLWNDKHAEADVIPSCRQSLADLQLDYLDMYLVHWPFPNFHPPGCDVQSRSPDATPYIHENYMKTWRQMEKLVDLGLVRHIGTSNMTIPKLKLLLRDARIKPAVNEMEMHPHFQQTGAVRVRARQRDRAHRLLPDRFARRVRSATARRTTRWISKIPVIVADRRSASACIPRWSASSGRCSAAQTPIPFSVKPRNYLANLQGVVGAPLTRCGDARHRRHRPQLPPDQGPGLSVESRTRPGKISGIWME